MFNIYALRHYVKRYEIIKVIIKLRIAIYGAKSYTSLIKGDRYRIRFRRSGRIWQ